MASLEDIGLSALINILSAIAFLLAFAFLRIQPINDRAYFPKWYQNGSRTSPTQSVNLAGNYINLDCRTYLTFLNWIPEALRMTESKLIEHAGLDSAIFLRIYLLGLKIFMPMTILSILVLVPVNASGGTLFFLRKDLVFSNIDKLSISNVSSRSKRFFIHIFMMYLFTTLICYLLYKEYARIAFMRMHFLASQRRRVDHFTVVVRNVPHISGHSLSDTIDDFFKRNHSDTYLTHQMINERQNILNDSKAILPVAFVSFNSRRGAAVCAQTQQSKNPTLWLTDWAPEPQDVYWENLAISFVSLIIRKLIISVTLFALIFFYMLPIALVQSLANLEGLEKVLPFLKPIVEVGIIKSFLQGFLPGLFLKIFLEILLVILMIMSKVEGHISFSVLDRKTADKYYYFMLVNVFLGSIVTGTAFEQLHSFLHQSPTEIPRTIGVSIPMKATFFITYIMVDGWAGSASEILRLKELVVYHLKNMFLVKTEKDRVRAMYPERIDLPKNLPKLELYFLFGIVYGVVTPVLLPFIVIFFGFAYLVYRHQVINVYNQVYDSAGAFWPHVHGRIVASLLISQFLLLGLLSTKKAANSTPLLLVLPILTIWFHKYCKSRFEPAFGKYPLEEAVEKDTMERVEDPDLNHKAYLSDAYLHPIFRSFDDLEMNETVKETSHAQRSKCTDGANPVYHYYYVFDP